MTTWRLSVVVGVLALLAPGVAAAQVVEAPDAGAVAASGRSEAGGPADDAGVVTTPEGGAPAVIPLAAGSPGSTPPEAADGGVGAVEAAVVVDAGAPSVATSPEAPRKKPLPKGFVGIVGVVTDALSGEGLIEA
ncbi:MAG: hypothetical protein SFW67_18130, partial [Myxococcaceae bacterium]|nr:hypothetical protein [Myxococcaceae bacterium]